MPSKGRIDQQVLEKIKALLESLEYGTVQITIHDPQVTQIDKLERHRLPLQKSSHHKRT
ncbi:YezD family protein (plasmid) [Niallia sp. XMNu-256]|uniref:YezD family protein n=1 Tax=Niallia sp. XMNu-256 TaxID=3082444 RepID=UPI0030CCAF88